MIPPAVRNRFFFAPEQRFFEQVAKPVSSKAAKEERKEGTDL